jgi:hypothetical protein
MEVRRTIVIPDPTVCLEGTVFGILCLSYLYILDDAIVAHISLCVKPLGGEGVGRDIEQGPIAGSGDCEGSNGD